MRYTHEEYMERLSEMYGMDYERWLDKPYRPEQHKKWTFYEFGDDEPKPKDNDDTFGVIQ
jgi:hypothetical protein